MAFDLGSSGVRLAASALESDRPVPSRDMDLLTPLMGGQRLEPLIPLVEAALRELPQRAGLPDDCQKMGGGFSAWRLAWSQDGPAVARQLDLMRQRTGVAVLIIPGEAEGHYGHASAAQTLGSALGTSHILDLGGGSLQVGGAQRSFSIELGQKSWHWLLCRSLAHDSEPRCALQPLTRAQVAQARRLADEHLARLPAEVGPVTLTAISRPVTRGIRNALRSLGADAGDGIELQDLRRAIDRLAGVDLAETARLSQTPPAFAEYLLSDMLLVERVLVATGNARLALSEAPINNLPAMLHDQRAFDWAQRHGCYLARLGTLGPAVYFSDPVDCPVR